MLIYLFTFFDLLWEPLHAFDNLLTNQLPFLVFNYHVGLVEVVDGRAGRLHAFGQVEGLQTILALVARIDINIL